MLINHVKTNTSFYTQIFILSIIWKIQTLGTHVKLHVYSECMNMLLLDYEANKTS